jgi:PAS domain S-box-containing protein
MPAILLAEIDWTQVTSSAFGGGALTAIVLAFFRFVLSKDKPQAKRISDLEALYSKCMERDSRTQREIGALQATVARMESEHHPVGIVVSDSHGLIVEWNEGATILFGYSKGEVVGKMVTILVPLRLRDQHDASFLKNVNSEINPQAPEVRRVLESSALKRDGSEIPVTITLSRFSFQGSRYYTGEIKRR